MAASFALKENRLLAFLPRPLLEPRRPLLVAIGAWLLAILGSLLIATVVRALFAGAKSPDFDWFIGKGLITVFALAVATPLVETLILAATTSVLLRIVKPQYAILISSLGWGLAHSYRTPIWGLVIFWPFIIFTTLYVVWKQRSLAWGIAMPWAVHVLQNLIPAIAIGYPDLLPGLI